MMPLSSSGSYMLEYTSESIKAAREEFINMIFVAKSQSQTTAAAAKFIKQISEAAKPELMPKPVLA
jgi:hypothetical protein